MIARHGITPPQTPEISGGLLVVTAGSIGCEKLAGRNPKSLGESIQVVQAEVTFGSFYTADVGSMESCLFGQGFL